MSFIPSGLFYVLEKTERCNLFSLSLSLFLFFVYLSYLSEATDSKDEEIKVPKRLFLGMYWCVAHRTPVWYYWFIYFFSSPSSTPLISSQYDLDRTIYSSNPVINSTSLLTPKFHLHVCVLLVIDAVLHVFSSFECWNCSVAWKRKRELLFF